MDIHGIRKNIMMMMMMMNEMKKQTNLFLRILFNMCQIMWTQNNNSS